MPIFTQIGIFLIVWWVVLFVTLPLWVRSQSEEDGGEAGTDPGAPVNPDLGRKFLLTTGIAFVVSAILITSIELGVFDSIYRNK